MKKSRNIGDYIFVVITAKEAINNNLPVIKYNSESNLRILILNIKNIDKDNYICSLPNRDDIKITIDNSDIYFDSQLEAYKYILDNTIKSNGNGNNNNNYTDGCTSDYIEVFNGFFKPLLEMFEKLHLNLSNNGEDE